MVQNNFFVEKNPTIVTFPVRNLELRESLPLPPGVASKYDLVANICHEGEPAHTAARYAAASDALNGMRRQAWRGHISRAGVQQGGRHLVRATRPCLPMPCGTHLLRPHTCRYDAQDLAVAEVLPQQVALSECFVQIYERKT